MLRGVLTAVFAAGLLSGQAAHPAHTRSPHGKLDIPCESCHTASGWRPIRAAPEFDHNTQTPYPLRGRHRQVQCRECHTNLEFNRAGTQCADCHADLHRRQFGARCQDCHTVRGWRTAVQSVQDHRNRFPLLGAHAAVACDACHHTGATGVFAGLSTECASCHLSDYQSAKSPDHVAAALPLACQQCHRFDQWQNARFDHAKFTGFELRGVHAQLDCSQCHVGGLYRGTSSDCFSCHAAQFNATRNPNHVKAGLPHTCSTCHTTVSWQGALFDHQAFSGFPLTGAHAQLDCSRCHVAGRFAAASAECYSCHRADFDRAKNPDHSSRVFSTRCESCHNTTSWDGAQFDHGLTSFPLTGAHTTVTCQQCHTNGRYAGTPTDCAACHLEDYNQTSSPNHAAAGFPTDCSLCHSTAQWPGATFDHSHTGFPLTGAHATQSCQQCHVNGQYAGLSAECAACHQDAYNATQNPNHAAAGFPLDCSLCHSTAQWSGAVFDHSQTRFPLTGSHRSVACASCHVNGTYRGTPTDCFACHRQEYETVTDPNHAAAGFPTTCATCHNTSHWSGASFDHRFPIYHGKHKGKWQTCADCHTNPANYASFTCLNCHAHEKAKMDDKHKHVNGYVYDSPSCLSCHPNGDE